MAWEFGAEQIVAGLVGLGLVLKGILEASAKKKVQRDMPERGCLYGDSAHDELKQMIREVDKTVSKILTILEERKNG